MSAPLTEELLADLRKRAENDQAVTLYPPQLLAILDQVATLERNANALLDNDKVAMDQLARALGWKDGGPGWQAALDAIVEMRARIEAPNEP